MTTLTRAQWFLLSDVAEDEGLRVSRSYRPAKRLVELGFCEWRASDHFRNMLDITYDGRAQLAKLPLAIGKIIDENRRAE